MDVGRSGADRAAYCLCVAPLSLQQKAHVFGHTFDQVVYLPSSVAISIAVEPALIILISVCYVVVGPLLGISHARLRVARTKLFPISEPNAHHVDFGSGELAFANEAKLEQNFVTGAGCIFYVPI